MTKTAFITLIAMVSVTLSVQSTNAASLQMASQNNQSFNTTAQNTLSRRGDGTFYNIGGGYTACGETHSDNEFYAAIAPSFFTAANRNSDPMCQKCALVTGPKGQVKVRVNDVCPSCAHDAIDMTPAAFNQIANPEQGRVSISWDFTNC
ncbi:RlpA-like double-psi beta-barrel-protein domain-containing protein-containing protein [Syncephalis fuscata]|nr:RlpA-like double-psi beta-barrel-protein domain-containing protein-containing protein [Syncephalis fuscata]